MCSVYCPCTKVIQQSALSLYAEDPKSIVQITELLLASGTIRNSED
jgi:hypothetical protein